MEEERKNEAAMQRWRCRAVLADFASVFVETVAFQVAQAV